MEVVMNKFIKILFALALVGLFAPASNCWADDTDIYAAGTSSATNPNILVVIDNSANWDANNQHWPTTTTCGPGLSGSLCKQGAAELSALSTVVGELGDNINLGLMMFDSNSTSYVRYHIRQMTCANKTGFQALLAAPNLSFSITSTTNSVTNKTTVTSSNLFCSVRVGMFVTGTGIPAGAYVTAVNSNSNITISANATSSGTSNLTFTSPVLSGTPASFTCGTNSLNTTPNCIYQNFASSEKVATAKIDYSAAMFEVFKYFGGYTSPAHALDNVAGTPADANDFGPMCYLPGTQTYLDPAAYTNSPTDTIFNSPLSSTNSCAKNFVIFIGNGYPSQDSPASLLTNVGGDATQMKVPDFTTTTTPVTNLLTTTALGAYSSVTACQTAAATTYGTAYTSYTCTVASTGSPTALGTSACGTYSSSSACQTGAATTYPGYISYSCTANGTACSQTLTLLATSATSYTNDAAGVTACQTAANTTYGSSYGSYICNTPTAGASATAALGSSPSQYTNDAAGIAACKTYASSLYGSAYASYTCTSPVATTTTATPASTACGLYASTAACGTAYTGSYPGGIVTGYTGASCVANAAACSSTQSLKGTSPSTYTNDAAGVTACQTGAGTTYGTANYSYFCTSPVAVSTNSYTMTATDTATTACGLYATQLLCNSGTGSTCSPAAGTACSKTLTSTECFHSTGSTTCTSVNTAAYPTYSSFTCTANATSCTSPATGWTVTAAKTLAGVNLLQFTYPVTTALGTSAYGTYASVAACQTGAAAAFPGHTTYTCTLAGTSTRYNYQIYGNDPSYNMTGTTTAYSYTISGTPYSYKIYGNTPNTSYNITGTQSSYNIYGNGTVTSSVATGSFTGTSANNADEWARFLYQTDLSSATGKQNATTYAIDVYKDAQDANETKLLMSMARAGGGKYFSASDESAIKNAMRKIFAEIQSVNSVFASSSLPVSVNTQGTYLNQVFMGMFRPDGGAKPRWAGNLKQYKFKIFGGTLRLSDKNGDEAISSTTGFVTPCSDSFWSTDTGTYWNYSGSNALGTCTAQTSAYPTSGSTSAYSDSPDGEVVEKGGAAQRLRGVSGTTQTSTNYSTRTLKTCDGSSTTSCTAFTNFNSANAALTATAFGITAGTQSTFIDWVRGKNVDDEKADGNQLQMRPSVHGGVVHSQPAVVDYAVLDFTGATGVMSYYGGDDGVLHAVVGNQADTDGNEVWGFIAPETFGRLNRLRDNGNTTALINFPGVTGTVAQKDYFFDGAIGVYQHSSTIWIFPSMRRGGRALYAFDVSTASSPAIKWRRGCFTNSTTDDTNCSSGWSGIGQTWSKPIVTYLAGYTSGGVPKPILVFGGGYDTCDDTNSQTRCTGTRKGANIWFVDADTGTVIRTYPTNYSVPGDLSRLQDDNGNLTNVYATDTGGYVYRISVGSYDGTTFTGWTANTSASLITLAYIGETNQARKFLFGPTVVPYSGFNTVLMGTGDREHPLVNSYACGSYSTTAGSFVQNQFYMVMDKAPNGITGTLPTTSVTASDLVDVTNGTTTISTTGTPKITNITSGVTTTSTDGWLFDFGQCEQAVNKPLVIAGVTYFGTNAPSNTSASSCSTNLGIARGYAVDFLTGNATAVDALGNPIRDSEYVGGGLPPSPVAGVVDVDGVMLPFCIGCIDPNEANASALSPTKIVINPSGARFRTYWYIEKD
jgi:hypothetical protein